MKQSRKKWFVAAICIIVVLALGTGVCSTIGEENAG